MADNQIGEQIGRGAEAVLTRSAEGIIKSRPKKSYRHPQLDVSLRESRTRHEAKILEKAKAAGIRVPTVKTVDDTTLLLSEAKGEPLKNTLDAQPILAHEVGRMVAKLHEHHLIHADLTTSNIIHDPDTHHLTLIDFGLSYTSSRDEDKAVDLHLFHQALESKHHRVLALSWRHFLKGYRDASHNADIVLDRLKKVESRGRNKGS
jgi:Kae1-associated kinase Bud32